MIALLLSLILTAVSIPFAIIAEDGTNADIQQNEINANENVTTDETPLIEDLSKRDSFAKHYAASNGERYAVVFSEQVHYEENGEWVEVDNRLTLDTATQRYTSANERFSADFAANTGSDSLVSISDGEYSLSWSVMFPSTGGMGNISTEVFGSFNVASANAQLMNSGETAAVTTLSNMESMGKAVSSVRYNGVYGGGNVDLRYTVMHEKVEEDIILNSLGSFTSYVLAVNTGELTAVKNADGSVSFGDSDGNAVFTVAAPWMKDANGEVSDDIEVELIQRGELALVGYIPSREWLTNPERAYPVLIDPSFVTRRYTCNYVDTYLNNGVGTNETRATESTMKVGGVNRAYVKILNVPALHDNYELTRAEFRIYAEDVTSPKPLSLHAVSDWWNWDRVHGGVSPSGADDPNELYPGCDPSSVQVLNNVAPYYDEDSSVSEYTFDITDWLDNKYSTQGADFFSTDNWHGFKITSDDSSYVMDICSSEYFWEGYRPTLIITYTYEHDDIFVDEAIYSIKAAPTAASYLTVGYGEGAGTNVHMKRNSEYDPDSPINYSRYFMLDYNQSKNSFYIRAAEGVGGNNNYVRFDLNSTVNENNEYVNSNVYLGGISTSAEWLFECVDGNNTYKIVSRADPNLALSRINNFPGSDEIGEVNDSGNVYIKPYSGGNYQHWKIESGGVIQNSKYSNICQENFVYVSIEDIGESLSCSVFSIGDIVSWSSSNENIICFDDDGKIATLNVGMTDITATVAHLDGTTTVYTTVAYVKIAEGIYLIENVGTGKFVEVEGNSNLMGANIQQNDIYVPGYKQWEIEWEEEEYYRIKSVSSGYYIAVNISNNFVIAQYPSKNDWSKWKIQKTPSGNYKILCASNYISGNALIVPNNLITSGTNLTTGGYENNNVYNDEWEFCFVEKRINLAVKYDHAYTIRYPETLDKINNQIQELQKKFIKEFGIFIDARLPELFTSYGDTCSNNYNQVCNCEETCINSSSSNMQTYHHTNVQNNLYRIEHQDKSIELTIAYVGHTTCSMTDNGTVHKENCYLGMALSNKGVAMVMNFGSDESSQKTTIHEFGHFYGVKDHYSGIAKSTEQIIEETGNIGYNRLCIYGEDSLEAINGFIICDGCKSMIENNIDKFNHN